MNIDILTRALPAHYSAQFHATDSPEMEDDEIKILLHGVETCWGVQCAQRGWFVLNEYGYDNGELDWCQSHGEFLSLKAVAVKLRALLEAE
jgi:hypothetical protein